MQRVIVIVAPQVRIQTLVSSLISAQWAPVLELDSAGSWQGTRAGYPQFLCWCQAVPLRIWDTGASAVMKLLWAIRRLCLTTKSVWQRLAYLVIVVRWPRSSSSGRVAYAIVSLGQRSRGLVCINIRRCTGAVCPSVAWPERAHLTKQQFI